jgi:hypothetical protein
MSEVLLSIEAVTTEVDDKTFVPVHSFAWGFPDGSRSALRTLTVVRALNDLSPAVALLLLIGEPRSATLSCAGDDRQVPFEIELTDSRVVGYQVTGDGDDVTDQVTLQATQVEMTCGGSFVVIT